MSYDLVTDVGGVTAEFKDVGATIQVRLSIGNVEILTFLPGTRHLTTALNVTQAVVAATLRAQMTQAVAEVGGYLGRVDRPCGCIDPDYHDIECGEKP